MSHDSAPGGRPLIVPGYACAVAALAVVPVGFALAGAVIGTVNLVRGHTGHGIAQIVISVACGAIGIVAGATIGAHVAGRLLGA